MKPAVECVIRPRRPSDDLPSSRAAMSSGSVTSSYVEPSTNSPGCRMNASSPLDLDLAGQVGLVRGGVDVRVLVVVEDPEELVEPHVDAGRLDHRGVEGVEPDAPGVDLGQDVAVGEKHGSN